MLSTRVYFPWMRSQFLHHPLAILRHLKMILAPQTHSLRSLSQPSTLVHENKIGSYSNRLPTKCVWSMSTHQAHPWPIQSNWCSIFSPTHLWPISWWICIFFRRFGNGCKVSTHPQGVDHSGFHGYSWMVLMDALSMDDNPRLCSSTPLPNRFCSNLGRGGKHTESQHHTWRNTFLFWPSYWCHLRVCWRQKVSNIYWKKAKIPECCWFDWLASPKHTSGPCTITFFPLSLL